MQIILVLPNFLPNFFDLVPVKIFSKCRFFPFFSPNLKKGKSPGNQINSQAPFPHKLINMAAAREIPDLETQRKEISQDMRKSLREGDTW